MRLSPQGNAAGEWCAPRPGGGAPSAPPNPQAPASHAVASFHPLGENIARATGEWMVRRCRLGVMLTVAFASLALGAAEVELIRVWPGWRDAEHFERIGEFFGAPRREVGRNEIVLRTHETARAGYYFLVRLKNAAAAGSARFEISVIRPDALQPVTFAFPVALRPGEIVYQLGLTGTDWPEGKNAHPVAWRFALIAADGKVLAEQKSFLWEKPAK